MRPFRVVLFSVKPPVAIMPKKNAKQVQDVKSETSQATGPITVDKSGSVVIKINAKPGAKNNNITGRCQKKKKSLPI